MVALWFRLRSKGDPGGGGFWVNRVSNFHSHSRGWLVQLDRRGRYWHMAAFVYLGVNVDKGTRTAAGTGGHRGLRAAVRVEWGPTRAAKHMASG